MNELVKFSVSDAAIAELSAKYMPLKVKGLQDQAGLAAVHSARMDVKGRRVDLEKTRKKLKEESLEYGRKVDAEAKRLNSLLAPIESHLEAEESIVAQEKERLKQIEDDRKQALLDARLLALADCETMVNPVTVQAMDDETFAKVLEAGQAAFARKKEAEAKADLERQAAEAAAKVEADRLAKERAELDKQRAEQAAAQKVIDDEKRRLDKIEQDRLRAIELEKAKAEAAEKARVETEQRLARQKAQEEEAAKRAKAEAEIKAAAEEAARVRAEALRPDREKLLAVGDAVEAIDIPDVSAAAQNVADEIADMLRATAEEIRRIANRVGSKEMVTA